MCRITNPGGGGSSPPVRANSSGCRGAWPSLPALEAAAVQVRDGLPIGQMPEWLGSALQKRPRRFNSGSGLHAPVARAERHRSSKSGHAGSNPVWSSTLLGANSARTIAQDIVVIVVLLLRWATGGCALEDQLLFHGRVAQRMSADFLHRRMHVRIVSRSPTWRVNWAGAQRRLLSDRPG
jgi:hypothetical protein